MKLLVRRALAFFAWTPLIVAAGCGNQGEGERCDPKNQSNDCDYGLFCNTTPTGDTQGICCPVTGAAKVEACNSSGPPREAGPDDGRTFDATADGTADAGADSPTDNATTETTVDRAPDTTTDTTRDNGAETSVDAPNGNDRSDAAGTPDQSVDAEDETSIDAPEPDVGDDASSDATPDVSTDSAVPDTTPVDASDADASADSAG